MTYWHRPLQDVLTTLADAGFIMTTVTEPPVSDDTSVSLLPNGARRFIAFLFLALEAT